ncbi:MAG: Ig-like domain-containing protein [Clostridia bacterium]|nr:Ig-like domain-containing protein [Clostridia bacterium]
MRKTLVVLLLLALFCACIPAMAEGSEAVSLELNAEKLPVFAADDPLLADMLEETEKAGEDALPVLLIPLKKSYELNVTVLPKTVKNKRYTLSVDDSTIVKVYDHSITGSKKGSTVLTIASKQDPEAMLSYRVLVIQPVSSIAITPAVRSLPVGGSIQLTANATPESAPMKAVTWKTENPKIATVDENGVITGIKRGETRVTATACDGSRVRVDMNVRVVQTAEQITLAKTDVTVDVGKTAVLKATVQPANTDNKNLVWTSTDTGVATVNAEGRVKGIALGECQIICASKANPEVTAAATVHVQQPVTKVVTDKTIQVYAGESTRLTWRIEPANASNQTMKFTSSSSKIVTVAQDGTITGVKHGEAYVTVAATDGSEKSARIKVSVIEHVTGVHMLRKVAYINVNEIATAGAQLEPKTAGNNRMSWYSMNPGIASVSGDKTKATIKGIAYGDTTIIGITEDGGYQTSLEVKVGEWNKVLRITDATINGKGHLLISVKNTSTDLNITKVTLEIEAYLYGGEPAPVNTKDGSNIVRATYSKRLRPGRTTPEDQWTFENYDKDYGFQWMTVRVVSYQIDNDWVKTIPKRQQPKFSYTT